METEARHLPLELLCDLLHAGVVALDVHQELHLRVTTAMAATLDVHYVDTALLNNVTGQLYELAIWMWITNMVNIF